MWLFKFKLLGLFDQHLEGTVSIILRLPGLFLIDSWCKHSFHELWQDSSETSDLISFIVSLFVLIQGLLLILLPLQDLITLYMHYISAAMIAGAELLSRHYVASEVKSEDVDPISLLTLEQVPLPNLTRIQRQIAVISLHIIIATIISYLMDFDCNIKKAILAVYTVPVAARLADFPNKHLLIVHNISTALTVLSIVFYSLFSLPKLVSYFRARYREVTSEINELGLVDTCIVIWNRVYLLAQLFVYWVILVASQIYINHHEQQSIEVGETEHIDLSVEGSGWSTLVLYIVSEVCNSIVGLTACCVAVMYFSWAILYATKLIAQGFNGLRTDPNLHRAGMAEAITMSLLAFQTGLVDLPMPQRMGAMLIILFIVVGALVQSMHELVEPVLLALSASNNRSITRHLRVLSLCTFLLVFPIYMTVVLCSLFEVDFWTLVVVSTCALTSVQVLGALTVYSLFLYDSLRMDSGWEALDDTVYVARAITRSLEFLVAVLVVGAGIHESVLLSYEGRPWSWLNGSVLAVHCYYNVYMRLQSGWHSFLLRRDAARKIHSLPCATPEQLLSRSHDVCAICYVEMKSARVTPCQHLFHATCLKKWLYVQDRCPLCSAQVTYDSPADEDADGSNAEMDAPLNTSSRSPSPNNMDGSLRNGADLGVRPIH